MVIKPTVAITKLAIPILYFDYAAAVIVTTLDLVWQVDIHRASASRIDSALQQARLQTHKAALF